MPGTDLVSLGSQALSLGGSGGHASSENRVKQMTGGMQKSLEMHSCPDTVSRAVSPSFPHASYSTVPRRGAAAERGCGWLARVPGGVGGWKRGVFELKLLTHCVLRIPSLGFPWEHIKNADSRL